MENISVTTDLDKTFSTFTDLPSKAESIAWTSVYALEALLIVMGNSLTIILSGINKKLRKKSLLLIVNMAFADLLYGGVLMPFKIYFMYIGYYYQLWEANHSFSVLDFSFIVIFVLFLQCSLMSSAMISCERFYAIYYPLKHRTLSKRVYHVAIFVKWMISFSMSIVGTILFSLVSRKLAFNIFMACFLTLLSLVCGSNIGIWRKFRRRRIASEQPNRELQNQRLTKTLLFVSCIALMSWLPVIIINFLMVVYEMSFSSRIYHVTVTLNVANWFVNPVIYALRIPEFRRKLGFFRFKKQAAPTRGEDHNRKNDKVASVPSETDSRTFGTEPSHQKLATGGYDTKL